MYLFLLLQLFSNLFQNNTTTTKNPCEKYNNYLSFVMAHLASSCATTTTSHIVPLYLCCCYCWRTKGEGWVRRFCVFTLPSFVDFSFNCCGFAFWHICQPQQQWQKGNRGFVHRVIYTAFSKSTWKPLFIIVSHCSTSERLTMLSVGWQVEVEEGKR